MKIGLVSAHSLAFPGGVQGHVLALASEFKKRGHQVKIIAPRRHHFEDYGKNVILLGGSKRVSSNDSRIELSLGVRPFAIPRLLRQENFDLLHFHNLSPFLSFQILQSSICPNILTLHALLEGSKTLKFLPFLKHFLRFYLNRRLNGLIVVSRPVLEQVGGLKPTRIIPNGVDLNRFNPEVLPIQKLKDGKINLLFVGRIERRKGLIYLLQAFRLLKKKFENLRLIVVGSGPLERESREYTGSHRTEDVVFVGQAAREELPRYYATADIFVSPATHGESFGIVLLEAMASGVPVVAFANRGYQEVLKGRGAQFLVRPRNVWELAKKIEILIKDENLRKEMGKWGLKEAQKYSWDKIAGQVLEFYGEILKGKTNISED